MTSAFSRAPLRRTVAVANGKGGVGKTSITTHIAGLVAASGRRVLLVDLDPQGNAGDDLGYIERGLSDDGYSLARAVRFVGRDNDRPKVFNVRPNLDVIAGGRELDDIASAVENHARRIGADGAAQVLAQVLAQYAGDYALTVLDCPPRHPVLQDQALVTARYLLIPTKTDVSSCRGLDAMAERFGEAQRYNPALTLLGVVLFSLTSSAKRARAGARAYIDDALGGQAPIFEASIRNVETAAYDIRVRGQLAHELEAAVLGGGKNLAASSKGLAADYQAVAIETMNRIVELEAVPA
jgi:chromosome partitioning protein